jgi:hypothetical protein
MRYLILICMLISTLSLFANPVSPVMLSEVYMDNASWWIELSPHWFSLSPGDSIRISNQSSSIQCCVEDSLNVGDCFVVYSTQYPSLLPPFTTLSIAIGGNGNWSYIDFNLDIPSSYPNNCIPGQSLVYQVFGQFGDYFEFCAEASPTPGTSPNQVTTFGTLYGYVRDRNMVPVPNARINYSWNTLIYSDANGYYNITGLCGCQYTFQVHIQNTLYAEQDINIIPGQIINHDFVLSDYWISNQDQTQDQTLPVMISSNPIHAGDNVKFDIGNSVINGIVVNIYNIKGEIVAKLYSTQTSGEISLRLPSKLATGIYLYHLGDGHKILKKGKITVID